jgi:hypothetical protein
MPVVAGGLVGFLGWTEANYGQYSSITDCYATGNVTADNPNNNSAALYAGGLVGYMQIAATYAVTRNFASGSVSARTNGYSTVYSGGIVGYRNSGLLQNNAALGASVTATGSGSHSNRTRRVYGYPNAAVTGISGNYAKDSMRVETSYNYSDSFPPAVIFDTTAPVLSGNPVLSGSLSSAAFGPLYAGDSGGSGLAGVTCELVDAWPANAGGSPVWNGNSITGIDLSGLKDEWDHYLYFNITLKDIAGNTAVYYLMIYAEQTNPAVFADFYIEGPYLDYTEIVRSGPSDPNGEAVAASAFYNQLFWTRSPSANPPGLGFGSAWNLSRVASMGYPRLAWE